MPPTGDLIEELLASSPQVRYAAVLRDGALDSRSKVDLSGASTPESDAFEERIVNPTLLTLLKQRGDLDCGGLRFVVVRYGRFFQVVVPLPDGHASVALELGVNPPPEVRGVVEAVEAFRAAEAAADVARGTSPG